MTSTTTTSFAAKTVKTFKASSIDALLSVPLPAISFPDEMIVKASALNISQEGADSMGGASATPTSILTCAVWHLAKAGHSKLELSGRLPQSTERLIKLAYDLCPKAGNGYTAGTIRKATAAALTALLTAPIVKKEEKEKAGSLQGKTVQHTAPSTFSDFDRKSALSDIFAHGGAMDNHALEGLEKYAAKYAAAMAAARSKAEAHEAEQVTARSLAENAYRSLQAEIKALRSTLADVSNAKTLKEVKALIAASGFQLTA